MNYRHLTGPRYDEDCQCHCMDERNLFQNGLDEVAELIAGKTASSLTDVDLDAIREAVSVR